MKEDAITKNERVGKRKGVTIVATDDQIKVAAEAINELAKGVTAMRRVAKDKLIVLLLHDQTGIPRTTIKIIIDAIPDLLREYMVQR